MYEYQGTVTKVVDGDTVDVQVDLGFEISMESRFRLLGIDVEERFTPLGNEAKAVLEYNILGKEVEIKTHKDKTGKYGRYLADVYLEGENIIKFVKPYKKKKNKI